MFVHTSTGSYRYYNPITASITVTALAWVNPEEVEDAFGDAQRQLLRGDSPPPTRDEGTLEVVKFVARRMRERPAETWKDRWEAWKRTNPSCPYNSYNAFRQVYGRFMKRYVYRKYELPNYVKRERTPYEVYRDRWNDQFTGRKGGHVGLLRCTKYTTRTPLNVVNCEQARWHNSGIRRVHGIFGQWRTPAKPSHRIVAPKGAGSSPVGHPFRFRIGKANMRK
jgi:hypothetical protein